jgi:hypothetical protein
VRGLDPGWLFVAAGLAACAAGILAPARTDLDVSRRQLRRLLDEKAAGEARLAAHDAFLRQLDQRDPALLRRLAASQLNLVPADQSPLLMAPSARWSIPSWIEPRIAPRAEALPPPTMLSRLTAGRARLWFMGAGVLAVFAGLLLDGGPSAAERRRRLVPHWAVAAD